MLRSYVRTGQFGESDKLVDETLATLLNASRNSVRAALQELADEGVLVRSRYSGTRLAGRLMPVPVEELTSVRLVDDEGRQRVQPRTLARSVVNTGAYIREKLGVEEEYALFSEHVSLLDGEPVSCRETFTPVDVARENFVDLVEGVADWFPRVFGEPVGEVHSSIEAVSARGSLTQRLQVPDGAPLLLRETVLHGRSGRPWMLNFTHYRGDRVCLTAVTDAYQEGTAG
jgi:GntR family transcriptional regulator